MLKSSSKMNKRCLTGVLVLALLAIGSTPSLAFNKVNKSDNGVAIKGYDSVAYHTEGRAVKGKEEFSYKWNDAEWYFASAKNRDLFAANPERFAPKYGGYCAGSLSATGRVGGVNPEAFKIIDGKLYLNWSKEVLDKFTKNATENIKRADENWNKLNESN